MRTDAAAVSPPLASALETLRSRGLDLRRGTQPMQPAQLRPSVPSGHAALDAALATGGWPRGAVTLLDAPVGGGATTLALGSVAAAQAGGGLAAWLDVDGTFDPAVAARLGVQLDWLLIAHPADGAEAVELAAWLGRSALLDAVVLDLGERSAGVERRALDRLGALLARAGATSVLAVAPAARATVGAVVGVRVSLRRTAWLALGADLVGQRVNATVERHRWALAGGSAELDLWFAEGRRTDALAPRLAQPRTPATTEERPALRLVGA